MNLRLPRAIGAAFAAVIAITAFCSTSSAQAPAAPVLTGKVSSQAEGAMEGVAVTAQRDGSPMLGSVYSNAQGQYPFPGGRLEPESFSVSIGAAGYVLPGGDAP